MSQADKPHDPTGVIADRIARRRQKRGGREQPAAKRHNPTMDFEVHSTDFRRAMRQNVRATFILIAALVMLSALVGYVSGWAADILAQTHPRLREVTPEHSWWEVARILAYSEAGMVGIVITFCLSLVVVLFTFLIGDRALMRISGARLADPEKDQMIHNLVEEMSLAARCRKPRVYIIETDGLNAFASGIRKSQASVAVTRGLMKKLNREELQGVVAHEIGHLINGDIRYSVALAVMVGLIGTFAFMMREVAARLVFVSAARRSGSRNSSPLPLFLPVALILFLIGLLAPIAATLLKLAVSREREYLADATAVRLTRNPRALASALYKISHEPRVNDAKGAISHLFIEAPGATAGRWFATHPPIDSRIRRLLYGNK